MWRPHTQAEAGALGSKAFPHTVPSILPVLPSLFHLQGSHLSFRIRFHTEWIAPAWFPSVLRSVWSGVRNPHRA